MCIRDRVSAEPGIYLPGKFGVRIDVYKRQSLPFIAPICISTIQLGATVDYAILMTTRYKSERLNGNDRKAAVYTALRTSAPSVIVSGLGLFAATFGVAVYSNIDIVASMCMLMARGAIISVLLVLLVLLSLIHISADSASTMIPSILLPPVCATTARRDTLTASSTPAIRRWSCWACCPM